MQLLILVYKKFKAAPELVFRCAYDYEEIRIDPKNMENDFLSYWKQKGSGKMFLEKIPEFVEDFCLDLLAGRTVLPTALEMSIYK
jgi:hypothetical protein